MITLITGVPGSGKTLYFVSELSKKVKNEYKGKKIYIDGIPELKIEICSIPDGQTIKNFNEWAPLPENQGEEGALVVIDEAQRVFPPRSASSAPPALVEWLHVHRHAGVDIVLITQMPMRIDKQVRDLVGAHYHIHKTPIGVRMIYFWDYCANNPKSEMKNARPSVYKLDKKAFGLYKSAQIHTKVATPKSRVRWLIPLAVAGAAFSFYSLFGQIGGFGAEKVSKEQIEQVSADSAVSAGRNMAESLGDGPVSLTKEMFEPTIAEKVESKPLYDRVRQVRTFEYPVACISGGNSGCTCYTHQGTAIKEIGKKTCNTYVKDGLPFNPYRDERQNAQNMPIDTAAGGTPSPAPEVLVMGGKSPQNLMYDGYVEAGEQFR
ncbi:zonular occludens toxin domain-containing protein [Neisseria iguanae]|uniref:Zonular occludens toxin n=1 Tax=Neisseria iguanae TaxID=90242 RepID=A0A2P7TYK8_9NEIS|nr:zonular occludens toxin domain-containing protein [Neisseria iguanae]PSJ79812.1 zonular occludens toxin [Neisseria iguanae]